MKLQFNIMTYTTGSALIVPALLLLYFSIDSEWAIKKSDSNKRYLSLTRYDYESKVNVRLTR